MKKTMRRMGICLLAAMFFWCGTMIADRQRLGRELIRMHVVANSDSQEDQYIKTLVRDAVTDSLKQELRNMTDIKQAMEYLREKLPYIRSVAEDTLASLGCQETVSVSLCRESFDTRQYDTFRLPAGVYHALRIVIGQGEGKNWWCVVFPEFCIPVSDAGFDAVAAGAGFPGTLKDMLKNENGYDLRFGILDALGRLENILFDA